MILPTRRALAALATLAPLGLLGYLTPLALDLLLAADGLLLAAIVADALLAVHPRALQVRRDAPEAFSVGRSGIVEYRWSNASPRRARLTVREVRPDLLGGAPAARRLEIAAGEEVREHLAVLPVRRGRATEGWFAVRSRGPLGLGQRHGRLSRPWKVTVYPRLPAERLRASIAAAVRQREAGLRAMRRPGEGRQFESLREWVPGEDPRHIDWKATARHRKLIARQYEEERRQQVLLVVDAGRLLTAEVAGRPRMEYVVRATLRLAFAANYHDDNVGIMTFADEILSYTAPQRGRRGLRQILEVLAVVEPRLVEPDYPAAFRYLAIRNRKRALTIFFTDVIDRLASRALVGNIATLRPRHLPLVVTLRNAELDRVAESRPTTPAEAYRKAAAEELLATRESALGVMRSAGALVLDVPPEQAADAAVKVYLELKRHGRL